MEMVEKLLRQGQEVAVLLAAWEHLYEIGFDEEWVAEKRDGSVSIYAPTAEQLVATIHLYELVAS